MIVAVKVPAGPSTKVVVPGTPVMAEKSPTTEMPVLGGVEAGVGVTVSVTLSPPA